MVHKASWTASFMEGCEQQNCLVHSLSLLLSYCYLILSVFLHPFIRRVDIDLALSGVGTVPSVLCTHLISWACLLLAVSVPWHFHFGLASALTLLILKMPPFFLMTFSDAPYYCVAASLYAILLL